MLRGMVLGRLSVSLIGKKAVNPWTTLAITDNLAADLTRSQIILTASICANRPPRVRLVQDYKDVEFPIERRKLRFMDRAPPPPPARRPPKMTKRLIDVRGPELIHNKLIHRQYGIRALQGGQMRYGHIEMMRLGINRKLIENRMFAVWRIDSPWKPVTKKGQGHRMGGGKGAIDHYVTPVKSGRIIVELGGHCDFEEVYPILKRVAAKLPFKAEAISQDILEQEATEEEYMKTRNLNPFSFEYCLRNNFLGSRIWASKYDYIWHGKHR